MSSRSSSVSDGTRSTGRGCCGRDSTRCTRPLRRTPLGSRRINRAMALLASFRGRVAAVAKKPLRERLRRWPYPRLDWVIERFGDAHPEATFIQIGANEGHELDPLTGPIERRRWTGVMVEPVPYVFERLW